MNRIAYIKFFLKEEKKITQFDIDILLNTLCYTQTCMKLMGGKTSNARSFSATIAVKSSTF